MSDSDFWEDITIERLFLAFVSVFLAIPCGAGVIYVDADANGANDGSSWTNAYNYLQDALADANSSGDVNEIWVAEGIYTPDSNSDDPNGSGDRKATFKLMSGLAIYGGFASGGCDWEDRDPNTYETILSGDLNGNDAAVAEPSELVDEPTRAENSYHVVTGDVTGPESILDGLTITGGNANGNPELEEDMGAGVYHYNGSLLHCLITGNSSESWTGGALYDCDGPIVECAVNGNSSYAYGGGLCDCDGLIMNCVISGNNGGGLYDCDGLIINCKIVANKAIYYGAGLSNCDGSIMNCIISGNSAEDGGGLSFCNGSISNCTVADNFADRKASGFYSCDGIISNCIIWNNSPLFRCTAPLYSCVQGDSSGIGCISIDPMFVSSGYWDGGNWVEGDYHLQPGSPCIDTGNFSYHMELPSTDIDGNGRLVGGQIDMGCFEFGSTVDTDGDWLADASDSVYAEDPDRDGDGILDGVELLRGSDPNVYDPLDEWDVPGDACSIQEALFFSRSGEEITLGVGTYYENIYIGGRNVTLTSTDPNNFAVVEATVVDGNNARVVQFQGTENENCCIQGMTLTGGYNYYFGGGIYGAGCRAHIRQCLIKNNYVEAYSGRGGGLFECNGSITACTISNNSSGYGGGLGDCDGSITGCTISGCSAQANGGGLYGCDGPITGCTINACTTSTSSSMRFGGGIDYCHGPITNCTITGNLAAHGGGVAQCSGPITGCTITGNSATMVGAGLYFCTGPIVNCTISGNMADDRGGIYHCTGFISNCIIWDNLPADTAVYTCSAPLYSCVQGDSGGIGSISLDPMFVNSGYWDGGNWVEGDYHLQPGSPCIDTGNFSYHMELPSTDIDGNGRLVGGQMDMGCFEFGSTVDTDGDWLADVSDSVYAEDPDRDGDGILDGVELLQGTDPNIYDPLDQWNVPGDVLTIQEALFFSRSGEEIILEEGTYYENIYIGGRNVTLTSTDPNNSGIVSNTTINGDTDHDPNTASGRVVMFEGSEDESCSIQGLTLTGGYTYYGGGLNGNGCRARIRRCVISNNSAMWEGGGLAYFNGSITSCVISNNEGGGLYYCDGTITNCTISDSQSWGGLSYCDGAITNCLITGNKGNALSYCNGPITNCTISNNSKNGSGGAVVACNGPITGCIISHNSSTRSGAGLDNCHGPITNCLIVNNVAAQYGGGLYECDGPVTNCTIIGNLAGLGSGLFHCAGLISNCIIWDNLPADTALISSAHIYYSCVQGGWPGLGNIDADPCFVEPGYWDANGTPNDVNDDFWVDGDYHLKSEGWRWNAEWQEWDFDRYTSRCIDAGNPGSSLGEELLLVPEDPNNEWGQNLRTNMGAYGGTAEASMPPYDWALLADCTNDGTVDFVDFAHLATLFGQQDDELPGDFDRDGDVDLGDVALLTKDWLKETSWY